MKIDGKQIAEEILTRLTSEVSEIKKREIEPTLAIILVGDDPGSLSYIKQKQKAAEKIGAKIIFNQLPSTVSYGEFKNIIEKHNSDPKINGIVIQRPLPTERTDLLPLLNTVAINKDVDGFIPGSTFPVPVASAVLTILESVFNDITINHKLLTINFPTWLSSQSVAVIGRGETAGKPIADVLKQNGCTLSVIHSQTKHPEEIIKKMNIVVSCVGKKQTITTDILNPSTILIDVGIWKDEFGKLHGDYEEEEIADKVAFYTPTPGGVGPVNVACLMQNLIKACKILKGGK